MTMPSAEVRHNELVSDFSPPRHEGTKNHEQELTFLGKRIMSGETVEALLVLEEEGLGWR